MMLVHNPYLEYISIHYTTFDPNITNFLAEDKMHEKWLTLFRKIKIRLSTCSHIYSTARIHVTETEKQSFRTQCLVHKINDGKVMS